MPPGAGGMQPGAGGRRLPLCAGAGALLPGCSGGGQCEPGGGPEGALHTFRAGPESKNSKSVFGKKEQPPVACVER